MMSAMVMINMADVVQLRVDMMGAASTVLSIVW